MFFYCYRSNSNPTSYINVETVENGLALIQVVPTSFFVEDKYFYPKKSGKININKAIKHGAKPDDDNWYEVKEYKKVSQVFGKLKITAKKIMFLLVLITFYRKLC